MNPVTLLRWTARVWSVASFAFVAAFVIGLRSVPISPQALFFPVGVLAGIALGWRWEGTGGAITAGSLSAFYLWEFATVGRLPTGPFFFLIAAPGFLFLASRLVELARSRRAISR